MGLTFEDRTIRPLTVDEAMRMAELGIIAEPERVELLHGVLTVKPSKSPEHEVLKTRLMEWLAPGIVEQRYTVRVEGSLIVPDRTSLPEPDIAVVERSDAIAHPTSALLLIEVAVSSLRIDTQIKAPLFAEGGAPEYWVVDVAARRVEVFTDPEGDHYAHRTGHERPERLQPRSVPVEPLALDELFAGL